MSRRFVNRRRRKGGGSATSVPVWAAPLAILLCAGCTADSEDRAAPSDGVAAAIGPAGADVPGDDGSGETPAGGVPAGGAGRDARSALVEDVLAAVRHAAAGAGIEAFMLPAGTDLDALPQSAANPLTRAKVELGRALFHDTALALGAGIDDGTWSCATCHHAAASFKSGVRQGIGEGGSGFGDGGGERRASAAFDPDDIDVQDVASPSVLHAGYQDVMLWSGAFGAFPGSVNEGVDPARLTTPDTPREANAHRLPGLETQAIAGLGVHRLDGGLDELVRDHPSYRAMFASAFDGRGVDAESPEDLVIAAGLAIAAYERTLVADRAPFQRLLRGDARAMSEAELRGAALFFGPAGCSDCHRGPGLSSAPGADDGALFMALGLADLDAGDGGIVGTVEDGTRRGRGGFTGREQDDFRFKVAQLYNLRDAPALGHGASFDSVEAIVAHKVEGGVEVSLPAGVLDSRVRALDLDDAQTRDLAAFVRDALHDPDLDRYVPATVPSGACVTVRTGEPDDAGRCPGID